jgi:Tol biopolymer transport system component
MPSRGGEARILHRFEPGGYGIAHVWSADGKYLFFVGRDKVRNERSVCRVSVKSGEILQLTENLLMLDSITAHPDGRQIAFHTGTELDSATDVWVMQDYLPE